MKFIKFPDRNFSITCGNNPKVRKWLKENGCKWASSKDVTEWALNRTYLYVTVSTRKVGYSDEISNLPYSIINPIAQNLQLPVKITEEFPMTSQITLTPEQIKLLGLDPSKQVTLSIEDKPVEQWEPKQLPKGTSYYFIQASGQVNKDTDYKTPTDKERRACGNLFLTKEEAEQASAEIRAYLRLRAFAKEHDGDWKPNWNNPSQEKAHIYYSNKYGEYGIDTNFYKKWLNDVYMSVATANLARKMLNEGTLVL